MKEYVTVKTKRGLDIIGQVIQETTDYVIVENPLEIKVDPIQGMYAKSFLLLSEQDSVQINKTELMYIHKASDRAIRYYEQFTQKLLDSQNEEVYDDDDYTSDLEEIYDALLDSKTSMKH